MDADGDRPGAAAPIQRKPGAQPASEEKAPPEVDEVLRSTGAPLDDAVRTWAEPRLGHDLGAVRVHTGERAAASARGLGALAYTAGRHVVFGHGQYRPADPAGHKLIAHELAHVAQQATAGSAAGATTVGAADHPSEREADRVAEAMTAPGTSVALPSAR